MNVIVNGQCSEAQAINVRVTIIGQTLCLIYLILYSGHLWMTMLMIQVYISEPGIFFVVHEIIIKLFPFYIEYLQL